MKHAGPAIRSFMGDARGHWEGNTLVVETTNLLGDRNGIGLNGNGMPHSDALRDILAGARAAEKKAAEAAAKPQ